MPMDGVVGSEQRERLVRNATLVNLGAGDVDGGELVNRRMN